MKFKRVLRHLGYSEWSLRRAFNRPTLQAIEAAIAASERQHRGELRFVAEGRLPTRMLLRGVSARQRAAELFSRLRIWDTEENSGILIYVQMADRHVEILADRGIAARVPQADWDAICRAMEHAFGQGDYREGALAAIGDAGRILSERFPAADTHPNELPDRPLLL